jgi:hypothetical protein
VSSIQFANFQTQQVLKGKKIITRMIMFYYLKNLITISGCKPPTKEITEFKRMHWYQKIVGEH